MSRPIPSAPQAAIGPLVRVRQIREFTSEPVSDDELDALVDAARWSGSSQNRQAWRFVVIRREENLRALAQAFLPSTRALVTAPAAIAIVEPADPARQVSVAFDEGRVAERILVAASLLGLAAGISWVPPAGRDQAGQLLGLPEDRFVRTIVAVGHSTEAARRPKSRPGEARLPRDETVFPERWPA